MQSHPLCKTCLISCTEMTGRDTRNIRKFLQNNGLIFLKKNFKAKFSNDIIFNHVMLREQEKNGR